MAPSKWHPLPLRTVTPAFLGRYPDMDARDREIPFPVASLRGVLAYWLRALAGPYIGNNVAELLRVESDLFGRPADTGPARPSRILLRADRIRTAPLPDRPKAELAYLMGPGLIDDEQPSPRRLQPGRLPLEVKNTGRPEHADLFLSALWALRTFGGIGARSRRGFGTLAMEQGRMPLEHTTNFDPAWLYGNRADHLDDILACVATTLQKLDFQADDFGGAQPQYPCFAHGWFRLDERPISSDPTNPRERTSAEENVLRRLGTALREFRHPRPSTDWLPPPGQPWVMPASEGYRNVIEPHVNGGRPSQPFTDGALGLPIVYTVQGRAKATVEPFDGTEATRRASPLWLRVTPIFREWRLRSLAFHATWLPEDTQLRVRVIDPNPEPADVIKPSPEQVRARLDSWFESLPNLIDNPHDPSS
jgi:hypothetical protein